MKPAANAEAGTSPKTVPVAGGGVYPTPFLPRSRNTAMVARDVGRSGQKFPLPQPDVTPFIAAASTDGQKGSVSGTSTNDRSNWKTPLVVAAQSVRPVALTVNSIEANTRMKS